MVQIELCETNGQWSRFTDFYVTHRQRIIPGYPVSNALVDIKNYIRNGRGAILMEETNQVIGIGSFVLGLEDQGFKHKEIAVLGNSYFVDKYQSNRTFIRGLQVLADQIGDMNEDVKEVRIPTSADNAYTNGLYRKIADKVETVESRYGTINTYSTTYEDFVSFCKRFR
ncbi:hypothetical protein [Cohnella cholangitidis]|uniref:GNAT family N-acetyltransferase n=1 Tax=Cohnella cholangitidis TaxID=2598458 RepID=A0A7G5C4D8_9BACL|nr:hypothetical protein [Cohnella cholangitidis]QMV44072.1 hypothetical protein FPL14_25065 [Cohnella cholangitidis]